MRILYYILQLFLLMERKYILCEVGTKLYIWYRSIFHLQKIISNRHSVPQKPTTVPLLMEVAERLWKRMPEMWPWSILKYSSCIFLWGFIRKLRSVCEKSSPGHPATTKQDGWPLYCKPGFRPKLQIFLLAEERLDTTPYTVLCAWHLSWNK
jgi:hypothetical protein